MIIDERDDVLESPGFRVSHETGSEQEDAYSPSLDEAPLRMHTTELGREV